MFHKTIVKISEGLNKRNLLKICIQTTYPIDFLHIFQIFYVLCENENIRIFFKPITRIQLFEAGLDGSVGYASDW